MAGYTKNFNLKLPSDIEFYDIEDFNENFEKIDQMAVKKGEGIGELTSGALSDRPEPGIAGRYYFAQDTGEIFLDTGEEWVLAAASQKEFDEHKAENASQHGDLTTLKTSQKSSLVEAINELFTNVSNGKQLVGGAITDVDNSIVIPTDPTFNDLASAIRQISTGRKWASGTVTIKNFQVTVTGLSFKPSIIIVEYIFYDDAMEPFRHNRISYYANSLSSRLNNVTSIHRLDNNTLDSRSQGAWSVGINNFVVSLSEGPTQPERLLGATWIAIE